MPRGLTWKLCDLKGVQIASLSDRLSGSHVGVGLNANWQASVPLSFDDPAAAKAFPLYTVLKAKLDGAPLFSGIVMKPRKQGNGRVITINAVGQGYRAEMFQVGARSDGAGIGDHVSWNPWRLEGYSQASMFQRLLEHMFPTASETFAGDPGVGIINGVHTDAPGTSGLIARDRDFPVGTQIWSAWQDLTAIERGLDFQLTPLDREDGALCKLDTFYPMQGSDKSSDVIFHYNWGKENVSDFNSEPDGGPVVNRGIVLGQSIEGQPQRSARADQPESQHAFGTYSQMEGRTDLYDQTTLREVAQGKVMTTGWVQDFFDFIPALDDGSGWARDSNGALVKLPRQFGQAPRFGPGPKHDAWLGDIIRVVPRDGAIYDPYYDGRTTDLGYTETEEGSVVTEVKCTPVVQATGVTVT